MTLSNGHKTKAGLLALLGAATLAAATGITLASSAAQDSGNITVGLIVKDTQVPFWLEMRKQALEEAKVKHVTLIFVAGRYAGDNTTQVNAIENMITRHVNAIAVAPSESAGIVPAIRKAQAAGIPVIAVDTATEPLDVVKSFIASDSYNAGLLQGKWAYAALNGNKPVIVMMHGQLGSQVDTDRANGFLAGFGHNAKAHIVASEATGGIAGPTQTATENVLTAHPDVNVIWNIDDDGSIGAGTAASHAGLTKNILITGMDGGCPQIKALSNGAFQMDVMQFPGNEGKIAVDEMVDLANHKSVPPMVDAGEQAITDAPQVGVPSKPASWGLVHCFGSPD
jgi:fructose transport system substrate-binding protein